MLSKPIDSITAIILSLAILNILALISINMLLLLVSRLDTGQCGRFLPGLWRIALDVRHSHQLLQDGIRRCGIVFCNGIAGGHRQDVPR